MNRFGVMFWEGENFKEGTQNYLWAMRELRKLPHPYPLVVQFTPTGEVEVHFSRPL